MMTKVNEIFLMLKRLCLVLFLGLAILMTSISAAQCALVDIGPEYDEAEYLKYCNAADFTKKYNDPQSSCWSCDIINVMFEAMKKIIIVVSKKIIPCCQLVLTLGFAIWIAMYLLKTLGSFATQEAGKVLDGIMINLFKVVLVYVTVSLGIDTMVDAIVAPLLSIGMDIGNAFLDEAGNTFGGASS